MLLIKHGVMCEDSMRQWRKLDGNMEGMWLKSIANYFPGSVAQKQNFYTMLQLSW